MDPAAARLLHEAPCGFLSFADDGRVVLVNDTLLGLLGYARDEVEGQHVERLLTLATRIFYQTHFFPLVRLHGRADEIYLALRPKAGGDLAVFANAVRRDDGDGWVNHCVLFPLRERRKYEDELLTAKRAAEAALAANEALTRDLEQALHELRSAQDRLVQEEKLASLGRMATAVAHEIKNPLNFVVNFGMLVGELVGEVRAHLVGTTGDATAGLLDDIDRNATRIVEHGRRADAVVQGMTAHVQHPARTRARTPVDVNAVARAAVARLRETRADTPEIEMVLDPEAGHVTGEAGDLALVLDSLLTNAVDAVSSPDRPAGDPPAVEVRTRREGASVAVVVSDNGPGIPEAHRVRVFEPFFTTHPPGSGRVGLGLSLTYNRVRLHGGTIEVGEGADGGATVTVTLPSRDG